jgi:hypothetical protein
MNDSRSCLICSRPQDDPLHQGPDRGGLARDTSPRIEQHDYDPGERRGEDRREDDPGERRAGGDRRKLIRRMGDRVGAVEKAL